MWNSIIQTLRILWGQHTLLETVGMFDTLKVVLILPLKNPICNLNKTMMLCIRGFQKNIFEWIKQKISYVNVAASITWLLKLMHRWQAGSSVLPGLVSKKSASRWVDACVVWVLRWVWLKQQQRVISCLLITMTFLSCWHCYTALNSSISFPWTPFLLMLTIFSR